MFRKKESEFQYSPGIETILEDIIGGGTIARADVKGIVDELPPLCVVGKDSNGLWHVIKTAKIVGGTVAAPQIAKNHILKVGDAVSDGTNTVEIASITVGDTYDTLAFVGGASLSVTTAMLYLASGVNTASTVTVEGDASDKLTISCPSASGVETFNGVVVELTQAADDNLAVSYANGKITIALANATASKNNAAAIQTALRALTATGMVFTTLTAVGGTGWDGGQTGAVLTAPIGTMNGGAYHADESAYKYTPEAITMNKVDTTVANQTSGLLARGSVRESVMPYPIDADLKGAIPHIRFV